MKHKTIKQVAALLLALVLLVTPAIAGSGAGSAAYIHNTQLTADLTYTNTISSNSSGRIESFMLTDLPGGEVYPIVMACDTIYGGMTITEVIAYASSLGYNVVGAINTDFYSTYSIPTGIVIENGIYKSSAEWNTAVLFAADGSASVELKPSVAIAIENNGGGFLSDGSPAENAGKTLTLSHFNKLRVNGGGMYLYSSDYSTISTRTSTDGWSVRFRIVEGEMTVSGQMTLEVVEVYEGTDAMAIGDGYLVLTADTTSNLHHQFEKFAVGDQVTLTTTASSAGLEAAVWATGGGSILVSGGQITDTATWDSSISGKNPRSALGIKADGTVVYYVVDGRSTSYSNGLTFSQLAAELRDMGCEYVINLDGGGSSAMNVRFTGSTGSVTVNSPSDGSLRRCGSYILLVTDNASTGSPTRLNAAQDGIVMLAGSSVDLTYLASDAAFNKVTAPADIAAVSSGLGKVNGSTYTAGNAAGTDTIMLLSPSTGAAGLISVHIVSSLSSITVANKDTGNTVTSISIRRGESVSLTSSATYWSRKVTTSDALFTYSVDGNIGSVTQDGVYTAGSTSGVSGSITVSGGGLTYAISVNVISEFEDMDDHWAKEYVYALAGAGIVKGVSETEFAPQNSIKRGDFVLMLYRASGEPEVTDAASFTDIPADMYYAKAIAWAEQSGVAKGTGDGLFEPKAFLTREQAFTFVYRSLQALGVTYSDGEISLLTQFADAGSISDYAQTPTATLVALGAVSGYEGYVTPQSNISRAEMAKILWTVITL